MSEDPFESGLQLVYLTHPKAHGTDMLFDSPAFIIGFRDGSAGTSIRYSEGAAGPNLHLPSALLACERGRQFGVLWGRQSLAKLWNMKEARFHGEGVIT